MREIKFRQWHNGRMQSFGFLEDKHNCVSFTCAQNNRIDKYPVMQFTGLKDKNDVDIYEGDFLGGAWRTVYVHWCDHCKSIEFAMHEHGCMCCSGDIHWVDAVCADNLEVIGNIHQHPELLEDNQ